MKFVVSTDEINYLVNNCQHVAPQKPPIPILGNIMIEAKGGELRITATDLKVAVRYIMEAKVFEEGSTTLPAKKFASLLRELTAANVEISTNSHHVTELVSGASRFKINGMSGAEYPELPDLDNATAISMPQEKLKEALARTAFAVSKEDNRYALTGVCLSISDKKGTLIGTDGKLLSRVVMDVETDPSFTGEYVIPYRAVEEMIKCLVAEGGVRIYLMPDKIALETENSLLIAKLLSGEYPDVARVIPEKSDISVTLHKQELISLLKQVALFAADDHHSVRFSFTNGELRLSANAMQVGEGKVNMPVNFKSADLEIAFNPGYFLDILRHSRGETVQLGLTDSFNPGVIMDKQDEGVDQPHQASSLFVIMPMRL